MSGEIWIQCKMMDTVGEKGCFVIKHICGWELQVIILFQKSMRYVPF